MKEFKCYVSGPIAHYDLKERMRAFDEACEKIKEIGHISPVNPFCNGVEQDADWREHMRADIGLLIECDYIYMMHGWELSKGCKLEFDVATSCGIKVIYEKD